MYDFRVLYRTFVLESMGKGEGRGMREGDPFVCRGRERIERGLGVLDQVE